MDESPFPHQGPLLPHQVGGRDDLIADLIERVTDRRVTTLLGPRRYGKTSVLRRVAAELEAAGTSVVWVDTYEVTSVVDVALRLDAALHTASGPVAATAREWAASVGVNVGVLRAELTRRRDTRPEPIAVLHSLLDALVNAARRHPTVVVFDEFGGVFGVDGVAGLLRTKLQHHYRDLGIVFAGSQPSLLRELFTRPDMPFYGQADLIEIAPFDLATTATIVDAGFRSTDRQAGALGARIHDFTGGHPFRLMQAADAAWRRTAVGETATDATWIDARSSIRESTRLGHEAVFSGFAAAERSVLRLLADRRSLFGIDAEVLGLSSSSAYAARDRLVASGAIHEVGGSMQLVDPVLADWVSDRFSF